SHSENFGIVVAEALACGTPVITTTGTPWQELTGRRCGWWVDPTVDALASSLKEATSTSAAEREEMGSIGREWMAQDFTWPAIAAKTIDFYESLIKS
ncbi:MAG: glycosyltransferase, partial [Verrucomicrobiales bacterium]|nr:glycosyltransferase [Verrucomicrobiales bacterium]